MRKAVVATLVVLSLGMSVPALAAPAPAAVDAAARLQQPAPAGTQLDVTDARMKVTNLLSITGIAAYLTDSDGTPLAGETIYFESAAGRALGKATTDRNGEVHLDPVEFNLGPGLEDELLEGYTAYYGGSDTYGRSQAHGAIEVAV
ncbi:hypothetical protein G5C51_24895 [Streptomyces sp. A7024]|uniref:Uncharacterized protein n=1 Tax=Streptomyces coryli TaxID=1128680 RepID=A0A6G4U4N4_9ACTN|nr:hypothetical protein [Streptomyces coryli]NGN67134.1 hypothetical protein [Streptomyces coryli]